MMNEFDVDLYKDDEKLDTIKLSVSEQMLTMEEVAIQCQRLLLIGRYDQDYDGFVVNDPSNGPNNRNLYMDLDE